MGTLDTTRTFTLKNNQTGNDFLLSTAFTGSAVIMSPARNVSENSQWFATVTERKAYYRLHTVTKGRAFALDVVNTIGQNSTRLYMGKTRKNALSQYWRFDIWDYGAGYRLSNGLTGLDMHLDVRANTFEPYLAPGDGPGQRWTLWSSTAPGTKAPRAESGGRALSCSGFAGVVDRALSAIGRAARTAWRRLRNLSGRRSGKPETLGPKLPTPVADASSPGTDPSPVPESAISGFTWTTAGSQPQELAADPDAVSPLSPHPASATERSWGNEETRTQVYELPSPLAELPDQPVTKIHVK